MQAWSPGPVLKPVAGCPLLLMILHTLPVLLLPVPGGCRTARALSWKSVSNRRHSWDWWSVSESAFIIKLFLKGLGSRGEGAGVIFWCVCILVWSWICQRQICFGRQWPGSDASHMLSEFEREEGVKNGRKERRNKVTPKFWLETLPFWTRATAEKLNCST